MGLLELNEVPSFPCILEFSDWVVPCWRELGRLIHIFRPGTHTLHSSFFLSFSLTELKPGTKLSSFSHLRLTFHPQAHRRPFSDHVTPPSAPVTRRLRPLPSGYSPLYPAPPSHVTASFLPDWLLPFPRAGPGRRLSCPTPKWQPRTARTRAAGPP